MSAVGVVIPALNEADTLPGILEDLQAVDLALDIVVVDGGSDDRTVDVACEAGARVVSAPRGRALQLNTGAGVATGEWLCFLHADVRMPPAARGAFSELVNDEHSEAAVWRFAIDAPGAWFRIVEFGAFLRDAMGGLPYGDQGLLVRRRVFEDAGGFPEIPIMEDVALVRAIRRKARLERLSASLVASARRWHQEGPYRTWFRNIALISAYLAGVSPHRLARWRQSEVR